jgi:prepilin-type N-terminal cleavage/methylation domain-containing protein
MRHSQRGRGKRDAFTLVELLVVIAIIAILVSLTTAGVMKLLYKGPKIKTQSEVSQFDIAIQAFENEFGVDYVPSYLVLREDNRYNLADPAEAKTVAYLQRIFGKNLNLTPGPPFPAPPTIDWNGNGKNDGRLVLEGHHCLVFFLGGIPSPPGSPNGVLGFSTSPLNPAQPSLPGQTRRGPFYNQFESSRLIRDTNGFFYYADAWSTQTANRPYAYFSAYGAQNGYVNSWGLLDQQFSGKPLLGDCPSLLWQPSPPMALQPYKQGVLFSNPRTHQVISAGQDQTFGAGGLWSSATGQVATGADKDNQTNFAGAVLSAGGQ